MRDADRIHDFWFGRLPLSAEELERRLWSWFGADSAVERQQRDDDLRSRFEGLIEPAAGGRLAEWAESPRGRLGLIILLDQFPRNIYRGTARAFAFDEHALRLTLDGLDLGADAALDPVERLFFYLPLQHAETLAAQDRAVALCRGLVDESPPATRSAFERTLGYAEEHRAIVERFGRFPHRNRVLGRSSTAAELEYLRTAQSFGQ